MSRRWRSPALALSPFAIDRSANKRLVSVLFALVLAGATLGVAPAAATTAGSAESPAVEEARRWQGRWCPLTGCGPAPSASAASVGGFAAAALGAIVLARRRRP